MKYSELYQGLEQHLSLLLKEKGFRRLKMAPPTWARPFHGNFTVVHVYGSSKASYLPGIGGHFYVKLFLSETEKPDWERCYPLMRFLSDENLQQMRNVQRNVIDRILEQSSDDAFMKLTLETWKPLMELEKANEWRQGQELGLRFLVPDDVEAWGIFLAQHLPAAIDAFESGEPTP